MLSFRVFAKLHSRRPLVARRFTLPVNVLTDRCPRTGEPHPRPFNLRLKGGCEGFASLTGRSLRTGLGVSPHVFLSTFNRRSRPCRDCRLSTSLHLPMFISLLSATLMGSPRMLQTKDLQHS